MPRNHSQPAQSSRATRIFGLVLAAFAGAAVMVVELGVARILTPVFGGSISVWAIVIATTMLALAAGYAFGGYRADRVGGITVARRAATFGALLCALIPFARPPLVEHTIGLDTLAGATITAVALIAPALFFLSQVSPALIRGLADDGVRHVGVTAGGIYAVSTVGSLVGTLAAVWLFLYLPLLQGFLATALLVLVPVILLRPSSSLLPLTCAGGVLALAAIHEPPVQSAQNTQGMQFELIDKRRSPYGEIRVIEMEDLYRYMIVNGFDQGGINLQTGKSVYVFDEGLVSLARLYTAQPDSVLLIGLGPGVIANRLQAAGLRVDSVEIDAEVVRVARDYFGYRGEAIIDDGRRFLQRTDRRWDTILVDAFAGGNPPWQLFTEEAFQLYRDHLNPGGGVVLNLIGNNQDPAQRAALEAVVTTARAVFPVVDTYPDPWDEGDWPTRNIFIAASRQPRLEAPRPGDPMQANSFAQAMARSRPVTVHPGRLLTDGSAPLEPLVRHTTQILRSRIGNFIPVQLLIH